MSYVTVYVDTSDIWREIDDEQLIDEVTRRIKEEDSFLEDFRNSSEIKEAIEKREGERSCPLNK